MGWQRSIVCLSFSGYLRLHHKLAIILLGNAKVLVGSVRLLLGLGCLFGMPSSPSLNPKEREDRADMIFFNRLLWCATAFMSFYGVAYYRREGYLPGASRAPFNAQAIDPDKEAFSTAPHDDEYAPVHNTDDHESEAANPYASVGSTAGSAYDSNTAYSGYVPPHVGEEPAGYQGYSGSGSISTSGGRLNFPEARYDNV